MLKSLKQGLLGSTSVPVTVKVQTCSQQAAEQIPVTHALPTPQTTSTPAIYKKQRQYSTETVAHPHKHTEREKP